MPKKSQTQITKKEIRKGVETKEDLIRYLDNVEGMPFLEELWDLCVEKAEADKNKQQPMLEKTYIDKDGNKTVKTASGGTVIPNPVGHYFRMMGLPQYKKKAVEILNEKEAKEAMDESQSEIMEVAFDDDSGEQYNEIIAWINMFPNAKERQYLRQRYASYYDNYDINEGADRVSLSRILSLEVELYRINAKRATGGRVDIVQEEKLTKMLRDTLESMKWTKKQRSAAEDMAQNKFTVFMEKMAKEGRFMPEEVEAPKDDIDALLEIIPKSVAKMLD